LRIGNVVRDETARETMWRPCPRLWVEHVTFMLAPSLQRTGTGRPLSSE
jgi:hypothetical protein